MKKGVLLSLTEFIILVVIVIAFGVIIGAFHFFNAKIVREMAVNVIYEPVSTQDALLSLMNLKKDYVVERIAEAGDFVWEKKLHYDPDSHGVGCGEGSAVLTLPTNYEKVILEWARFDDYGYISVNGQKILEDTDLALCIDPDLCPNIDISSFVHTGDNAIYGYVCDKYCCERAVEAKIHVYNKEIVKKASVTFAKAIVYGLYENTMAPKVFSDGYVVDFDIKKEAESYLKYVYPEKKYWLFLYDPATGIKIDLVKNAKDEDFDREPYGARDSVPLKPENYWLVLYVAK